MIIEKEDIAVLWTCPNCYKENSLICPVWEDIYGEYAGIECPDCLRVEFVSLGEGN